MKAKIVAHIEAEAEQWLGCAMTYTLFQSIHEHFAELLEEQPASINELSTLTDKITIGEDLQQVNIKFTDFFFELKNTYCC